MYKTSQSPETQRRRKALDDLKAFQASLQPGAIQSQQAASGRNLSSFAAHQTPAAAAASEQTHDVWSFYTIQTRLVADYFSLCSSNDRTGSPQASAYVMTAVSTAKYLPTTLYHRCRYSTYHQVLTQVLQAFLASARRCVCCRLSPFVERSRLFRRRCRRAHSFREFSSS